MNVKTNAAQAVPIETQAAANDCRAIVVEEIKAEWGEFDEAELSARENRRELTNQLIASSLEKANAQRGVASLSKGRPLWRPLARPPLGWAESPDPRRIASV